MISQNLPTDNLYKFMALFGLVIIICSAVFKYMAITNIQATISELRIEQATLKVVVADSSELEIAKAKLLATQEKLVMSEAYDHRATVFLFAGILLSIAGFVLWYMKTQRLLDKLLKQEASG